MSTEKKDSVPAFTQLAFHQWKKKFSGYLMRHKRAQLALSEPRPSNRQVTLDRLQGNAVELKEYKEATLTLQLKWDERNDIAISYLQQSVQGNENQSAERIVLNAVEEGKTCAEVLDVLKTEFFITDHRFVQAALRRFNSMELLPNEKGESFISRILEEKTTLMNLGKDMDDDIDLLGILTSALEKDSRYAITAAAIRTASDMSWKKAVTVVVTADAAKQVDRKTESASMAVGHRTHESKDKVRCQICKQLNHTADVCRWRNFKQSGGTEQKKGGGNTNKKKKDLTKIKCFKCGKMGHYASDCRSSGEKKRGHAEESNSSKQSAKKPRRERGAWDEDDHEYSAMMEEKQEKRA